MDLNCGNRPERGVAAFGPGPERPEISSYSLLGCPSGVANKPCAFNGFTIHISDPVNGQFGSLLALFFFMTINSESEKDRDWRKLCELVAHEQDLLRLSELVEQLIQKLDTRRRELRSSELQPSHSKPKDN